MQNRITKFYKITNWTEYKEISLLGDTNGMVEDLYRTIIAGRNVFITIYLDENGNGYESRTTILNDYEAA